ncbi:type II secretion system protein [Gryllotalpicola daejeonensis]|uniref:type II secretion system protein n=1 Tax=Gryllotalpicola daejeonensis TaxID=993087 RepID=UPI0031D6B7DF
MYFRLMGKLNARRNGLLAEDEKGFTLIELLVVVIIIGILAAIAIPVYLGVQKNAKDSAVKTDVGNLKTALVSLETSANGAFPTDEALTKTNIGSAPNGPALTTRLTPGRKQARPSASTWTTTASRSPRETRPVRSRSAPPTPTPATPSTPLTRMASRRATAPPANSTATKRVRGGHRSDRHAPALSFSPTECRSAKAKGDEKPCSLDSALACGIRLKKRTRPTASR